VDQGEFEGVFVDQDELVLEPEEEGADGGRYLQVRLHFELARDEVIQMVNLN
jgi:hypothetical protein